MNKNGHKGGFVFHEAEFFKRATFFAGFFLGWNESHSFLATRDKIERTFCTIEKFDHVENA